MSSILSLYPFFVEEGIDFLPQAEEERVHRESGHFVASIKQGTLILLLPGGGCALDAVSVDISHPLFI